jgi:hypothetical protein
VTLQKNFSHPSLVIYFFASPTHKTETGIANMWELPIANHLDESLCLANQKQGPPVKIMFVTLSLAGGLICCAFLTASAKRSRMQQQNYFS